MLNRTFYNYPGSAHSKKGEKRENRCIRQGQVVYLTYQSDSYVIAKEGIDASSVTFRKPQLKSAVLNESTQTSVLVQESQQLFFDAIYGITTLSLKTYLILVTKSHQVGQIKNKPIYQVDQVEFVQIGAEEGEERFQKHLKQSFNLFSLYYSSYNLTQRMQFSYQNPAYYEHSYFSNYLYTLEYKNYPFELLTKFIIGYVQTKSFQSQGITYHQTIISRANFNNIGRRWLRRGLNKNGYAANQFQIEYIIQINTQNTQHFYSYLQLRGSIPLQWSQTAVFKLKPKTRINQNEDINACLFKQYILRQQKLERNVHIVNLLGKQNAEQNLSRLFEQYYDNLKPEATYFTSWDYQKEHKLKGKAAFEQLMSQLREQIQKFSFFKVVIRKDEFEDNVENTQQGTFRTNCLDSVDRTNYVQMLFAKLFALNAFRNFKQIQGKVINPYLQLPQAQLQSDLKQIWINSGNQISYQNSGTHLMKLDFYDDGNRTVWGMFRDFNVGLRRHIYGHFIDYYIQNCMDLHFKKLSLQQDETKLQGSSLKRLFAFLAVTTLFLMPYLTWKTVSPQFQQPLRKYIISGVSSITSTATFYMLLRFCGPSLLNKPIHNVEYL